METKQTTKKRLVLKVNIETIKQAKILAAIAETTVSQLFENLVNRKEKHVQR